jgi:hypothetical protein
VDDGARGEAAAITAGRDPGEQSKRRQPQEGAAVVAAVGSAASFNKR